MSALRFKPLCLAGAGLALVGLAFVLGRVTAPTLTQSSRVSAEKVPVDVTPGTSRTEPMPGSDGARDKAAVDSAHAWDLFQQKALSSAGEEDVCAWLRTLACSDPHRALEFSRTAATPRQREIFRNAVLHGWSTHAPESAALWILEHVRVSERRAAAEALAAGAAGRPAPAVRAIEHLIASDPVQASDYGNALVAAFTRVGNFAAASGFARSGPPEFRAAWLCTVFHQWGTYQPELALVAASEISEAAIRRETMQGLIAGWGASDPAGLVAYAQTLPAGEERGNAFKDGLEQWVHRDPVAAIAWIGRHDIHPDFDAGIAAVALTPALLERKPEVAASWAESIVEPELRANTLLDLIRLWADRDVAAARHYAATTRALPQDRRELVLSSLETAP